MLTRAEKRRQNDAWINEYVNQDITVQCIKPKGADGGSYKMVGTQLGILTSIAGILHHAIDNGLLKEEDLPRLVATVLHKDGDSNESE